MPAVTEELPVWLECRQRERAWFTPAEAADTFEVRRLLVLCEETLAGMAAHRDELLRPDHAVGS